MLAAINRSVERFANIARRFGVCLATFCYAPFLPFPRRFRLASACGGPVFIILALTRPRGGAASAQTPYILTVNSGALQTLKGWGASQDDSTAEINTLPAAAVSQMEDEVYRDLRFNCLRLWVASNPPATVASMKAEFYDRFVTTGVLSAIQSRGVSTLLLAPAYGNSAPTEAMSDYAGRIAEFILEIKQEKGVQINVTGVANEPNFTPDQMRDAVKYLRQGLDSRGLSDVTIIAPESANNDGTAQSIITGIKSDSVAWAGLRGIATHSYNMAASTAIASTVSGANKEFWITEAGSDNPELAVDDGHAATIGARFLNDMNHMVDHWFWFIGWGSSNNLAGNGDAATLIIYDRKAGSVFHNLKYYYLKQLAWTFDLGAQFRSCTSATEGSMLYTYGQKPAINATAAQNPDGSWSVAVVNDTGVAYTPGITAYYPAASYAVTITINELANAGAMRFQIHRSSASEKNADEGTYVANNGVLTFNIAPKELVTLRSIGFFQTESLAVVAQSAGVSHRVIADPGFSGGAGTILDATQAGNYVTYLAPNILSRMYDVRIGMKSNNMRGQFQLAISPAGGPPPVNLGAVQDQYNAAQLFYEIDLGPWTPITSSDKWFRFTVVGKNPASAGFTECFDYIKLIPQ